MNTLSQIPEEHSPRFRALRPEPIFGADLRFQGCGRQEIEAALESVAGDTGMTLSGYLTENGDSASYHLSRYPRRRFGEPPNDEQLLQCIQGVRSYCSERNVKLDVILEGKATRDDVRIILGLQEGYLESKRQDFLKVLADKPELEVANAVSLMPKELADKLEVDKKTFSGITELHDYVAASNVSTLHSAGVVALYLGAACRVVPSEILTVGPWGKYTEPAAQILAPQSELAAVLDLAERFHQERIAVESLSMGQAYMVETMHCTDRDPQ